MQKASNFLKMEQILSKLRSVKLFLSSHPDNEENSEFSDRISDIQELQKEVSNLIEWKKSAMNIFSEIDLQAIGKELNIGLGQSVSENLLSKIQLHTEKNRIPVSSSVILRELSEKLIGMRMFVAEHYNDVGANGALTVINELERWIKVKVG